MLREQDENGGREAGKEIWYLNRHAVLLRPRRPLLDWLHRIEKAAGERRTGLAEARESPEAFLIPPFAVQAQSLAWVRDNYQAMFDIALESWIMDRDAWPAERSWELFQKWFDVEVVDGLWDLVDDPLTSDYEEGAEEGGSFAVSLEIVDGQLETGEPPIVRETFQRLMNGGRTAEEARLSIAEVLDEALRLRLVGGDRDPGRYRRRLEALGLS